MAEVILNVKLNDTTAISGIETLKTHLSGLVSTLNGLTVNKDLTAQLNALAKSYNAITKNIATQTKAQMDAAKMDELRSKQTARLAKSVTDARKVEVQYEKMLGDRAVSIRKVAVEEQKANNQTQKLANDRQATMRRLEIGAAEHYNKQRLALQKYFNDERKIALDEKKFAAQQEKQTVVQQKQTGAVREGTEQQEQYNQKIKDGNHAITDAVTGQKSYISTIGRMAKGFMQWQIAATLVMQPLQKLKNLLKDFNETLVKTEDSVIAIKRIISEDLTGKEVADDLYAIAQAYGQTYENVSEVATNFARTGMSWRDTLVATKEAMLALNVAELDASEASDGLLSIMMQFHKPVDELGGIVDELNKVADNFPVTTEKILTALQRTGSSADNANMSLEQTVGLITTLSKATNRSGENIGTALNSLIQYSGKGTALDTFSALDSDVSGPVSRIVAEYRKGAASIYDVWVELSKKINSITDEQADLLDQYFNTEEGSKLAEELSAELGDAYDDLQGVFSTANTFRKNYFIALLKNISTADEAIQVMNGALGYSQKENAEYLETYTAKLNTLKSRWQELANDEQGFLAFKKGLIDAGMNVLDFIEKIGGLKTVFKSVVAGIVAATIAIDALKFAFGVSSIQKFIAALGTLRAALMSTTVSAEAAQTALNSMIPVVGVIAAVIGIAAVSFVEASRQTDEFVSAQERANRVMEVTVKSAKEVTDAVKDYEKAYSDAAAEIEINAEEANILIDKLYELAGEANKSEYQLSQMANIVNTLNTLIPDLNLALNTETGELNKQRGEVENLVVSYQRLAYVKAANEGMATAISAKLEASKGMQKLGEAYIAAKNNDYQYFYNDEEYQKYVVGKSGFGISWDSGGIPGKAKEYLSNIISEYDAYHNAFIQAVEDKAFYERELEKYLKDLPAEVVANGNTGTGGGTTTYTGTGTSAADKISEEIKRLQDITALRKSELKLLQMQGASDDAQIRKILEIQASLQVQAAYYEQIGDHQLEINNLEAEWLEYEDDIKEIRMELLKSSYELAEGYLSEQLNLLKSARDEEKERLNIEEKRLAVLEKENALQNAMNERSVKVYNAATGRFEYVENEKEINTAQDELEKARTNYEDALNDQMIGQYNDRLSALKDAMNRIENGTATAADYALVMQANASAWTSASAEERLMLEAANRRLGSAAGFTFDARSGAWYNGGQIAYDGGVYDTLLRNAPVASYRNTTNTTNTSTVYNINGVPISAEDAKNYSVYELCRMLNLV